MLCFTNDVWIKRATTECQHTMSFDPSIHVFSLLVCYFHALISIVYGSVWINSAHQASVIAKT